MRTTPLHERLHAITGDRTYRRVGEMTGVHPETVRRYMQGQSPSTDFLTGLCNALHINGDWLLNGRGPMRADEARAHALSEARMSELLATMGQALEALVARVDRLEAYAQTLETRLRAAASPAGEVPGSGEQGGVPGAGAARAGSMMEARPLDCGDAPTQAAADACDDRARSIGDAGPERPREDDR